MRGPAAVHEAVLLGHDPSVGQPGLSPRGVFEVVAAPVLGAVVVALTVAGRCRRASLVRFVPVDGVVLVVGTGFVLAGRCLVVPLVVVVAVDGN